MKPLPVPYELPDELLIDTTAARQSITEFIRGQLREAGFERVVLGLSGGVDSGLVAYLVAEAIGADRLLAVLLPYRTSSPDSRAHAELIVDDLGCASRLIEVTPIVDGYFNLEPAEGVTSLRRGNFAARARMAVLYDQSVVWRGLVAGTGNRTESLLGYTTVYGDNASAFNPIGDLYKSQVRQLAADIGVPREILHKAPSADLWPGQTDEGEVGFPYSEVDRLLYRLVDQGQKREDLVAAGFASQLIDHVERMILASAFKRRMPPVAQVRQQPGAVPAQ